MRSTLGRGLQNLHRTLKKYKDAKALPLLELHSSLKRSLYRCSYLKTQSSTEVSGAYLHLCWRIIEDVAMPSSHYDCSYVSWTLRCPWNLMISVLTGVVGLIHKARLILRGRISKKYGPVYHAETESPDVPNYEAPVNRVCCSNCLESAFTVFIWQEVVRNTMACVVWEVLCCPQ